MQPIRRSLAEKTDARERSEIRHPIPVPTGKNISREHADIFLQSVKILSRLGVWIARYRGKRKRAINCPDAAPGVPRVVLPHGLRF